MYLEKNSKGTLIMEIEYLKQDVERLISLLKTSKEVIPFSFFSIFFSSSSSLTNLVKLTKKIEKEEEEEKIYIYIYML